MKNLAKTQNLKHRRRDRDETKYIYSIKPMCDI